MSHGAANVSYVFLPVPSAGSGWHGLLYRCILDGAGWPWRGFFRVEVSSEAPSNLPTLPQTLLDSWSLGSEVRIQAQGFFL